ncbi:hypothetical protein Sjap_013494 [Stephania japonica]|uniref:Uncharacterized protein n=1 Tax=Stephania japonica TaxID=461633 RepID=A0AAP0NXQ1_9MAGN
MLYELFRFVRWFTWDPKRARCSCRHRDGSRSIYKRDRQERQGEGPILKFPCMSASYITSTLLFLLFCKPCTLVVS